MSSKIATADFFKSLCCLPPRCGRQTTANSENNPWAITKAKATKTPDWIQKMNKIRNLIEEIINANRILK